MTDTTARDQLAKLVLNRDEADAADAILAAGWRPPARTVSTVEELDALPWRTVIRDSAGVVAELVFGLWYSSDGWIVDLRLPATVLYEPEEGE